LERDDCPPDYSAPIPERECPDEREMGHDKLAPSLENRRQDPGPHEVAVSVTGAAVMCPAPDCPTPPNPCPEWDRMTERRVAENLASQRCVRELVTSLGGEIAEDLPDFANFFIALLTWPQIDALAEHPHVHHIEPNQGDAPPP
jgi:hypothetical protein